MGQASATKCLDTSNVENAIKDNTKVRERGEDGREREEGGRGREKRERGGETGLHICKP